MKASYLQVLTVLSLVTLLQTADAGPRPATQQQIEANRKRAAINPLVRDEPNRYNRWLEMRVGPRFSWVDGRIRPGFDGSSQLDLQDDFKLDDASGHIQVDAEFQVAEKWYAAFGYTGNDFSGPRVETTRTLFYQNPSSGNVNPSTQANPAQLAPGSTLQADLEINTLSAFVKYDLIRLENFIFRPVGGAKAVFLEQNTTINDITTGREVNIQTEITEGAPLIGFEWKYNIDKHWYLGSTGYGFVFDKWAYLGGQAYFGYDIDQSWGLRLGGDADWVQIVRHTGTKFATSSFLTAIYLQGSYGF
jgi:hypothetical protein